MVLRKVLDKFIMRSEPKNGSAVPGNSTNSSKKQQYGGGEATKKMKKGRSFRVAPAKIGHIPLSKPVQPASKVADEQPNYMKSTSSYDKRKEKDQVTVVPSTSTTKTKSTRISSAARALVKNSSLKMVRASMKKNTGKILQSKQGSKATCSPTTDSKTLDSVGEDKPEGASAMKVCPYSFCSLHGHKHEAVPSLKQFLSLKVQNSMKLRGYSSIEKQGGKENKLVEDVVNELFHEIYTMIQALTLQQESGGQGIKEEIQIEDVISRMNITKLRDQSDADQLQESCSITSIEDCADNNRDLSMEEIQVVNQFLEYVEKDFQEKTQIQTEVSKLAESAATSHEIRSGFQNNGRRSQSTTFDNGFEKESRILESFAEQPHSPHGLYGQIWTTTEAGFRERQNHMGTNLNNFASENHFNVEAVHPILVKTDRRNGTDEDFFDGLQIQVVKVNDSASMVSEQPFLEMNNRSKVRRSRLRRESSKNRERIKVFSRRPSLLLEQQAEPEQEQVKLKHQTVEERKAAEEWMIDYAVRKALRRLTSVRKTKVPELVAAFETVLPQKV